MTRYIRQLVLSFIVGWVALAGVASATTTSPNPSAAVIVEQPSFDKVNRALRRNLNYYSLFDLISFRLGACRTFDVSPLFSTTEIF